MINLHSQTEAALEADNFEYAYLCDLPANLHYTNHATDLTIDGTTYSSNGLLLKFSDVKKDHNMKVGSYNIELSNVATAVANGYMTTSYRGHEANVYIVLLQNNVVQGDPILVYKGTLDTWGVQESRNSSNLTLKITSHWASYNQKSGNYTNDTTHQQTHSGDDFFKYAHSDKSNIGWGK